MALVELSTTPAHALVDRAQLDGLADAVGELAPALEAFTAFDTPERSAVEHAQWSSALDEPLPAQGTSAGAIFELLGETVVPQGLRAAHPGFSGWVATGPTTVPVAARLAAAVAGPLAVGIQSFNFLEALGLRWLAELLGIPPSYQGIFTSGGSIANLIGLGAARQSAFEKHDLDPARDGVGELPSPRIYASSEIHHCIYRAAAVLGLGRQSVVTIPADGDFRLDAGALSRQVEADRAAGRTPVAVVASAGTINTGAVDPLPELASFCREQGLWLHVDGAYGLFGVLDDEVAALYGSLADVDSMVVDPHKWLATCMGCGSVFVRDGALLGRAFTLLPAVYVEDSQPPYEDGSVVTSQFDDFGYAFHHFGLEHSLPSRGVEVWAVLKELGTEGVRERIRRHDGFARRLAALVDESPVLERLAPVTLSTCCFRYVPPELRGRTDDDAAGALNALNQEVLRLVRARGRAFPSATVLNGSFTIRACFVNPRTGIADVDSHVTEVEAAGEEAWAALRER